MISPNIHHSAKSSLVEDGSHSIYQPVGKALGQVILVFGPSNVIPENKITGKSEYTNTQQD